MPVYSDPFRTSAMSEHRTRPSASSASLPGATRGFSQQREAASPALPQPAALRAALEPLAAQQARD
eukprot:5380658-Heterocapsa_arctica.AAC.1